MKTTPTPPGNYDPCDGVGQGGNDGSTPDENQIPNGEIDETECDPSLDLLPFDRLKYPILANIVDGLHNKVKNNPKLMAAIKNFSHLTEQEILSNLETGKGPKVSVVDAGVYPFWRKLYSYISTT